MPNEPGTVYAGGETLPPVTIEQWRHKHILDLDDFSREEITLIFEITDAMVEILSRDVKKFPTLRGKTIATMFFEPSTRTRASFELAAKYLGSDTVSLDAARSSVTKGESLVDSLRTLQALQVDAIIMRHACSGAPYIAAQNLEISIINAGDGSHAHPSQGLLDLYTMRKHLNNLNGKKVVLVGDIMHSRVARSNMWGSRAFGINMTLCAPPTLIPHGLKDMLDKCGLNHVTIDCDLDRAIENADIIMPLRMQKERQQSGLISSAREYIRQYQVNSRRLKKANPGALVMHPGPINEGVEISHEVAYSSKSLIEQQVTNGVAIRMALLYLIAGGKNR
ncbi:MAG: aspartate carbamoyltransferase catalytic subunit [Dehalococcoidia bacterium]|nr:aspartate carbamoyltransferase catalytic subunit [Dehalococcoidia bacterium]